MKKTLPEISYPITFRQTDSSALGEQIRMRHPVELVGMKRVGISNFLRFFLHQQNITSTYINKSNHYLFIPVDLNDLVEREKFPFWILTFKRVVDSVEKSEISISIKKKISRLFLDAIQSRDTFLTIEYLRSALQLIVVNQILPTIFFLRFDRIKEVLSTDFFNNLQGLIESSNQKLSYVFTSFRTIDELSEEATAGKSISLLTPLYLKPASPADLGIIFESYKQNYPISESSDVVKKIIELCGGHVQYLQLSLIILSQKYKDLPIDGKKIQSLLLQDERIILQSEEIFESLSALEQKILLKITRGEKISLEEKKQAKYLWQTGIVTENEKQPEIFCLLFQEYLKKHFIVHANEENTELTKKEQLLFSYLLENIGIICEREKIIEKVWSEIESFGVSDWTIDKLVARLRLKLKKQNSIYSIVTVKTRGYKLIEEAA